MSGSSTTLLSLFMPGFSLNFRISTWTSSLKLSGLWRPKLESLCFMNPPCFGPGPGAGEGGASGGGVCGRGGVRVAGLGLVHQAAVEGLGHPASVLGSVLGVRGANLEDVFHLRDPADDVIV